MALKRVLDAEGFEQLDEAVRPLYVEQGEGRYRLDAEPDDGAEIKKALEKEREAAKALKSQLATYGDVDVDEYKRLREQAERAAEDKAREAGDFEELQKALTEKHARELDAAKAEAAALRDTVSRTIVEAEAQRQIAASDGDVELLLPHVLNRLRAVEVEGRIVTRVVDVEGRERISAEPGNDGPMTAAELLREMRASDTYGRAFKGSGASGAGATAERATAGSGAVQYRDDLRTAKDKADYIAKHGHKKFAALPHRNGAAAQ